MGNVSLNIDSLNAELLGNLPASELERVRAAIIGGPKSPNSDGTFGVPWTAMEAVYNMLHRSELK